MRKLPHAERAARIKARNAAYREAHRKELCMKSVAYQKSNRARRTEYCKQWEDKNRERLNALARDRYQRSRVHRLRCHKQYRMAHPDRIRATLRKSGAKRRAAKLSVSVSDSEAIAAWEKHWQKKAKVTCYWCFGKFKPRDCHTDHVIALSKGGPHAIHNLAISCSGCNLRKNDLPVSVWNQRIKCPVLL